MSNFVCGICATEHNNLSDYMACVAQCGAQVKAAQKAEEEKKRLEKMNAALNGVKQAKKYYEELLEKFKKEYPEEYKLNFGEKHNCSNGTCKCSDNKSKSESVVFSYERDGKNKPKMTAKVNGKDVTDRTLESLLDDPETRYIAKILGLI